MLKLNKITKEFEKVALQDQCIMASDSWKEIQEPNRECHGLRVEKLVSKSLMQPRYKESLMFLEIRKDQIRALRVKQCQGNAIIPGI